MSIGMEMKLKERFTSECSLNLDEKEKKYF